MPQIHSFRKSLSANWVRFLRSAVLKRANIYNKYKTATSRKIATKRDFREQGGGAEAEASNARQGIAKNRPRAQPLKAQFSDAQLIILIIKPQTHGKSQRSEIFVNNNRALIQHKNRIETETTALTPLRGSERSECTASTAV